MSKDIIKYCQSYTVIHLLEEREEKERGLREELREGKRYKRRKEEGEK